MRNQQQRRREREGLERTGVCDRYKHDDSRQRRYVSSTMDLPEVRR